MKVDMQVVQNSEEYRDVDVYVKAPSGEEWLFRIFRVLSSGEIADPEGARYAPNAASDFSNEYVQQVPPEVMEAFKAARPRALALLNEENP